VSADALAWLVTGLASGLVLITLPGTIELLMLTLGALLPQRGPGTVAGATPRVVVLVPAHDEAATIQRCVASLLACQGADQGFAVVVVADNCTDNTADLARTAGARVLERCDPQHRGKGYALDFGFRTLLQDAMDAVAVVDADTDVEPSFLVELRRWFASGADAVQVQYSVRNADASNRTRLMHVALLAFNFLRPRGRDRLGLSAGLLGNGFALSRQVIERIPYEARSVVEDLEYHLALIHAGYRVRFTGRTRVLADMPVGGGGVRTQRARWEGGRLRMMRQAAPGLAAAVARGRLRLLEPLLELLLLPLAYHVIAILLTLAVPVAWARLYALTGLGVVALHVGIAVAIGGTQRDLLALLQAPFYLIWKIVQLPLLLRTARGDAEWVRTSRDAHNHKQDEDITGD
jgi:cellulose synthase/poly-beta-1,6-N-acetylglucosamine synthase-like glycosyltransferase